MKDLQEPRAHRPRASALAVHEDLARLLAEGRRVAVATVVRARGSHPRSVGAKMLVFDDGRTAHTIGGGPLEASIIEDARAALAGADPGIHRYDLSESGERSVGMTCGGSVEVFIEVEEPPQRLVVFGAGHVGRAVARAAHVAGFALTVVDDRSEWLAAEAFPPGTALHRCRRDYSSDLPAIPAQACIAVMTRCHDTDVSVLGALGGAATGARDPRYIGLMGSRRKVARAFKLLESQGISRDWLATIHAPIGLAIGAETPGEIAIAVVAEIVSVLRGGDMRARSLSESHEVEGRAPSAIAGMRS